MAVDKNLSPALQHTANLVIKAGLDAAESMDKSVGRGERSREYFRRLAELLDLYTSPENLVDGNPQYPMPAIVAKQLGSLCKYLSVGIIPDPIKHCARRGRPLGPDEGRDVRYAVIYVLAAKQGVIRDRHPLETIVKEYGLSNRKTVQTWIVKHRKTVAAGSFADPELIKDRMQEAAWRIVRRVAIRMRSAVERQNELLPAAANLNRLFRRAVQCCRIWKMIAFDGRCSEQMRGSYGCR